MVSYPSACLNLHLSCFSVLWHQDLPQHLCHHALLVLSLSSILSKIAWSRFPTGTVFSTGPIVHIPRRLVWSHPHHHNICSSRSLFSPSKRGNFRKSRVLKGIRLNNIWFRHVSSSPKWLSSVWGSLFKILLVFSSISLANVWATYRI